jgi:phosphoribosylanthranilate isomerase
VDIVGEACGRTADEIIELCRVFQPDMLEIDSSVHLEAIASIDIPKILRVNIDTDNLPALFVSAGPYVKQFLLVGNDQDSLIGMEASVEIWAAKYPILVGLDIPEEDLDEWIEQSSIMGIGLQAGKEERPGFRDFTDLMSILEKLETE